MVAVVALDPASVELNRRGWLTKSQRRRLFRQSVRWIINGMFLVAFAGLLAIVAHNLFASVALICGSVIAVVWVVGKSVDCLQDIRGKRVAAITGRGREVPSAAFHFGDEPNRRCVIEGKTFDMLNGAEELMAEGDVTMYFAPRSRMPLNMEGASPG